ncbi:mitochondrial ribosomal [Lentinula edodes]|uniref:Mitochondrial ribosomal n=1 Tax=Lentinula edodes TaxID=5353 RepID=A0A1Q3E434_LENED|nr:mitochondrial ribosomal [Lentinula edodes]
MATAAQTVSKPYPFSKTAIILPEPYVSPPLPLVQGKGLMPYLQKNLTTPEKQTMLRELFGRHSAKRIYPGSIVGVTLEHAPFAFTGVVLAIRRRGIDTSMVLRNVIQRTETTEGKDEEGKAFLFEAFARENECFSWVEEGNNRMTQQLVV